MIRQGVSATVLGWGIGLNSRFAHTPGPACRTNLKHHVGKSSNDLAFTVVTV